MANAYFNLTNENCKFYLTSACILTKFDYGIYNNLFIIPTSIDIYFFLCKRNVNN